MNIKNLNKKILSIVLVVLMLLVQIPTFAANETVEISNWSKNELIDAERYGIFAKKWYKEGFQKSIAEEKANELVENVDSKIELENKNINKDFKAIEIDNNTQRKGFLISIYNVLVRHNIIEDTTKDPIETLNELEIVKGNGKDLYLDRELTVEEGTIFSKRAVDVAYEKLNAGAKGVIWEVENKGNKVYLLGSIHFADSSIYPYSESLMDKFNSSDELYVEVDISNTKATEEATLKMMEEMSRKMKYNDGTKLKDVIGEELYKELKVVMEKNEIPENTYEDSKPWAVIQQVNTFTMMKDIIDSGEKKEDTKELTEEELSEMRHAFENMENPADYGIDMYFLNKAKEVNKPVKELETLEGQMEILYGALFTNPYEKLSEKEQIDALKESIENFKKPVKKNTDDKSKEANLEELNKTIEAQQKMLEDMLKSWKLGDVKALKAILTSKDADPTNIMAVLLGDRDKAMAEKIAGLLEGEDAKQYFVVVGAAHYVTDGMVVDMLKDKGYEVKSLNK